MGINMKRHQAMLTKFEASRPADEREADRLLQSMATEKHEVLPGRDVDTSAQIKQWSSHLVCIYLSIGDVQHLL